MLTDLERDVLFLVEDVPGFEGAWRLRDTSEEDRFEVAVSVRDRNRRIADRFLERPLTRQAIRARLSRG